VDTASAKKTEPAPPPAKKSEPAAAKKPEPATAKKAETPAPPKPPAPAARKSPAKTFVYKVKPGETINIIARKFKVEPEEILRLNDLPPKTALQAGQLLTIQSEASR
jgi:LysM repeat protein